jgi:hypothetical protein
MPAQTRLRRALHTLYQPLAARLPCAAACKQAQPCPLWRLAKLGARRARAGPGLTALCSGSARPAVLNPKPYTCRSCRRGCWRR